MSKLDIIIYGAVFGGGGALALIFGPWLIWTVLRTCAEIVVGWWRGEYVDFR